MKNVQRTDLRTTRERMKTMNRNRNLKINFRINGKTDHIIKPKHGKNVKFRATKPKKIFKRTEEESE